MQKIKTKIIAIIGMMMVMNGCEVPEIRTLKPQDIKVSILETTSTQTTMQIVEDTVYYRGRDGFVKFFSESFIELDGKNISFGIGKNITFALPKDELSLFDGKLVLIHKNTKYYFLSKELVFRAL